MAQDSTLETFYSNWEKYQTGLIEALKSLTSEQLALRAGPDLRSVGELARHIAITRASWFHNAMGEQGADIAAIASMPWEDPSPQSAPDLVRLLETTWQFMQTRLDAWTESDYAVTFEREWQGKKYQLARSYIIWHLIEHDIHHGGELSIILGMHGLKAPRI